MQNSRSYHQETIFNYEIRCLERIRNDFVPALILEAFNKRFLSLPFFSFESFFSESGYLGKTFYFPENKYPAVNCKALFSEKQTFAIPEF